MLFLPNDDEHEAAAIRIIEEVVKAEGYCKVVGWRDVPVDPEVVGRFARVTQPRIKQVFLEHTQGATGDELEREMFILRKVIEKAKFAKIANDGESALSDFYICTMSSKTICYKASTSHRSANLFCHCPKLIAIVPVCCILLCHLPVSSHLPVCLDPSYCRGVTFSLFIVSNMEQLWS